MTLHFIPPESQSQSYQISVRFFKINNHHAQLHKNRNDIKPVNKLRQNNGHK